MNNVHTQKVESYNNKMKIKELKGIRKEIIQIL